MIQHPFNGGNNNNGRGDFIPQQNGSNSQFENSNKRTRTHEVNLNPPMSAPLTNGDQRPNHSNVPVNRGTTHIFYKTRMCQKFFDGTCLDASACTFAHGPNDLREPHPDWQQHVNRGGVGVGGRNLSRNCNWSEEERYIHQNRICKNYYYGDECPYGENCNFNHERKAKFMGDVAMDLERTRESSVINIKTVVDHGQSQTEANDVQFRTRNVDQDAIHASVKGSYWKTEMCIPWETTGQCMHADKCKYAHGPGELNTPVVRVEGDGFITANAVYIPLTDPTATNSAAAVPARLGRGFMKLAQRKINRIYGDWIDDKVEE